MPSKAARRSEEEEEKRRSRSKDPSFLVTPEQQPDHHWLVLNSIALIMNTTIVRGLKC
jgi:hypothetical protein